MQSWSLALLLIALVIAAFGFWLAAGATEGLAQILLVICLALFLLALATVRKPV